MRSVPVKEKIRAAYATQSGETFKRRVAFRIRIGLIKQRVKAYFGTL